MLKKFFSLLQTDPMRILYHFWSKFYIIWISSKKNIDNKGGLIINGYPLIDIRKGCKLYVGHNVTLNSRNKGYHLNLHSPVKLFADRVGAEIRIGDNTRIHGTCIHAYKSVVIGN